MIFPSFESWFDIASISETAEDIIAKEREQNILHMLHQVWIFIEYTESECTGGGYPLVFYLVL